MTPKTIVVLATLDTKGREAQFLRERIESLGDRALVIDTGVMGTAAARADIDRRQVAEAGGTPLAKLLEDPDRETAAPVMAEGAVKIVRQLHASGQLDAVLGLGGTQGTTLCTKAMRSLPYGIPKIMVSTMASGNVARWVDIKDVTMMFSVADILGLNPLTRKILANAAAAACGAAHVNVALKTQDRPLVAVTTVGITTEGAMRAIAVLEAAGYETITFHAIGAGGRAMEQLMREGAIGAVLDFATIEVSNQMFDALLAADDARLTTAGKLGLPQVFCPGAIEVLVFGPPETVPAPYRSRTMIRHSSADHRRSTQSGRDDPGGRASGLASSTHQGRGGFPDPDRRLRQLRGAGQGVLRSRGGSRLLRSARSSLAHEHSHGPARHAHQRSRVRGRGGPHVDSSH